MHWAAAAGRDSVLERLLSQFGSAAANVRSNEGFTPLHIAAGHGRLACVKVLLRHHADPNAGMPGMIKQHDVRLLLLQQLCLMLPTLSRDCRTA